MGRFLTQDPFPGFLHLPATLHPYQYALNDPLNLTDPSGEMPPLLLAAGIGAGIGGAMGGIHYMLSLDQPQPAGDGCCGAATSNEFQWSAFGRAVAIGATSGAVGGLVGYALPAILPAAGGAVGAIGGGAVTGAVSAGAEQVAFNLLTACAEWYDNVAGAMLFGGVTGGVTGGIGYKLRPSPSTVIKSYRQLKADLGTGSGLHVHHIVEKRFARRLGIADTDNMLSVILTPTEHQQFTNAWRKYIGYSNSKNPLTTDNATIQDIWRAAQGVYADYPDLVGAARKTIFER